MCILAFATVFVAASSASVNCFVELHVYSCMSKWWNNQFDIFVEEKFLNVESPICHADISLVKFFHNSCHFNDFFV